MTIIETKDKEIKILKNAVKGLARMTLHYRLGKPNLPEWVFSHINRAKAYFQNDDLEKL